jgi:hypothetical protein
VTQVRKRQRLTGMRYDRVDLVNDGANAHAHIVLAKNKSLPPRSQTVSKAMSQIKCNNCQKMNAKGASSCKFCHSTDLAKTRIEITKTVTNAKPPSKKTPKNDDATNAGQYTFEDEQYDQDNGENGESLGDAVERSVMNKSLDGGGWFEEDIEKSDVGTEVDNVDNEKMEHQKEGEDDDEDIETLAETKPTKTTRQRPVGYQNTNTSTHANTGMTHKSRRYDFELTLGKKKPLKKNAEKPGLNSLDHADEGSQNVAESAEQMYRANSQPTEPAQTRLESTMSDANGPLRVGKARRRKRSNAEGLDIMENGSDGVYSKPGVKRNGTGTGHSKYTTRARTAVSPPGNPLDKSRFSASDHVALEALNLGVKLAENMASIHKSGNFDVYPEMMADFVNAVNAAAQEWYVDGSVTKAKDAGKYAEDIANRAYAILAKASPASEMSDEAAEGVDPEDMDSVADNGMGKLKDVGGDDTKVGKNKSLKKSRNADYDEVTKAKFDQLDALLEERTQTEFINKAKQMRALPGFNQEVVAKQLRDAYEISTENGEQLEKMLIASANHVADSSVMKQFGMTGSGSVMGGDDMDAKMAQAYASAEQQIGKSNTATGIAKTKEQLAVEYMMDHGADFYQQAKSA